MRKYLLFVFCYCCTVVFAQVVPPVQPAVDNARIKICGQNMENYFLNLSNSFSSCQTTEALEAKTRRIVSTFSSIDADIYSMCELEVSNDVLAYLTSALNTSAGYPKYGYVEDNLSDQSDGATKVGFIYRLSTVRPIGTISPSSYTTTYSRRMRWITFEEIATMERFVVSMNHFKAKNSSLGDSDTSESTRLTNAEHLWTTMADMRRKDEDVFVLGDLNCTTSEAPVQYLIKQGLEEQLLRFNEEAYSYVYSNQRELIDHVLATESAASQVVSAGICHANTSRTAFRFSDHDTYVVGLNPFSSDPKTVYDEPLSSNPGTFTVYDKIPCTNMPYIWTFDSSYGMKATSYSSTTRQRYEADSWLLSPAIDLPSESAITLTFDHVSRYGGNMTEEHTLWISSDYTGSNFSEATWTQLPIPTYSTGTDWNFVSSGDIDLSAYAGQRVCLAFRYIGHTTAAATWEIKNILIKAVADVVSDIRYVEQPASDSSRGVARKYLRSGHLFIQRDGRTYDAQGTLVR